jgi:hypothetical protein
MKFKENFCVSFAILNMSILTQKSMKGKVVIYRIGKARAVYPLIMSLHLLYYSYGFFIF